MKIMTQEKAPQYKRDNIRSYLLIAESTAGARHITTSLVEMGPGGVQGPHHHATEQCYIILEGRDTMEVDGEKAEVKAGDSIFIPSDSLHGLINTGTSMLKYISAGSPVFGAAQERELWPINN